MGIVIKVRNEKNYVEYVSDNINDNLIFLQNYFIGKVSEIIDFKVVDAEYIDEDTFEPFEYEKHTVPLKCLLNDIKRDDSNLNVVIKPLFCSENGVYEKINALKYLAKQYVLCAFNNKNALNDVNFVNYVSLYHKNYCYNYCLKRSVIKDVAVSDDYCEIDLSKLPVEDLARWVIPRYYEELGMWDREDVRNDKELMGKLTRSWFSRSKIGHLD